MSGFTYECNVNKEEIYQKDEFTQVIFGYVIEQKNGKYKAFHGLDDKNAKYFETVEDGIKYVKSFAKK